MLAALTIIDSEVGSLTRYSVGGQIRKTHCCVAEPDQWFVGQSVFDPDFLDKFKRGLLGDFYCGPPLKKPGGDDPGGTPGAIHAPMPLAA